MTREEAERIARQAIERFRAAHGREPVAGDPADSKLLGEMMTPEESEAATVLFRIALADLQAMLDTPKGWDA